MMQKKEEESFGEERELQVFHLSIHTPPREAGLTTEGYLSVSSHMSGCRCVCVKLVLYLASILTPNLNLVLSSLELYFYKEK
jgi:hypothetical protein